MSKVMHASSVDCMSVYKDGVKMWGLYDTAIAHKVLEFQTRGRSDTTRFPCNVKNYSPSVVEPKLFNFGSAPLFYFILDPALAPFPAALYCHFKMYSNSVKL